MFYNIPGVIFEAKIIYLEVDIGMTVGQLTGGRLSCRTAGGGLYAGANAPHLTQMHPTNQPTNPPTITKTY